MERDSSSPGSATVTTRFHHQQRQRWFHSGTHSDVSRQHAERGAPPKEPFLSHTTLTRMSFARGCRVRLTGLAAAAAQHHNGKAATVCADFDKSTGRFIVLLDDGSQLAVKPINIQRADASSPTEAPAASVPQALQPPLRPPTAQDKVLVGSSKRVLFGLLLHEFTHPRLFAGCRFCPSPRRTQHSRCC